MIDKEVEQNTANELTPASFSPIPRTTRPASSHSGFSSLSQDTSPLNRPFDETNDHVSAAKYVGNSLPENLWNNLSKDRIIATNPMSDLANMSPEMVSLKFHASVRHSHLENQRPRNSSPIDLTRNTSPKNGNSNSFNIPLESPARAYSNGASRKNPQSFNQQPDNATFGGSSYKSIIFENFVALRLISFPSFSSRGFHPIIPTLF